MFNDVHVMFICSKPSSLCVNDFMLQSDLSPNLPVQSKTYMDLQLSSNFQSESIVTRATRIVHIMLVRIPGIETPRFGCTKKTSVLHLCGSNLGALKNH